MAVGEASSTEPGASPFPPTPRTPAVPGARPEGGRRPVRLATSVVAPILSLLGLAVAASATIVFLAGSPAGARPSTPAPSASLGGGVASDNPGAPAASPTVAPQSAEAFTQPPQEQTPVNGVILFVKDGNIWAASGTELTRLSSQGLDSSPAWSPDGTSIYFLERRVTEARVPYQGDEGLYTLDYRVLMKMRADGSDRRAIHDPLFPLGGDERRQYFSWLLQPDVSPDGTTIALVSDAPNPFGGDVTLSLIPTGGGEVRNLGLARNPPLGHTDPAWSPDGSSIVYTLQERVNGIGDPVPRLMIHDPAVGRTSELGGERLSEAAWSPDGRFLVAVRSANAGRDLVVLNATDGTEVARLTRDGGSFAPVWSPDGTQIAYLRAEGGTIDLHLLTLGRPGIFTVTDDRAVTRGSRLDGRSQPAWYGPRPDAPTPRPIPESSGSPP